MAGQLVVFGEDGKSSLCHKQLNPWTMKPSWIQPFFYSSSGVAHPCYKLTHLLEKPAFFFFFFLLLFRNGLSKETHSMWLLELRTTKIRPIPGNRQGWQTGWPKMPRQTEEGRFLCGPGRWPLCSERGGGQCSLLAPINPGAEVFF